LQDEPTWRYAAPSAASRFGAQSVQLVGHIVRTESQAPARIKSQTIERPLMSFEASVVRN
jgi:hypothetical protein